MAASRHDMHGRPPQDRKFDWAAFRRALQDAQQAKVMEKVQARKLQQDALLRVVSGRAGWGCCRVPWSRPAGQEAESLTVHRFCARSCSAATRTCG